MKIFKQIFINSATTIITIAVIWTAYAAISTVSSGDPLTADSWNAIVNKLNNTDTNSTDLVTKSYVDSTISANSGGGWSNCEAKSNYTTSTMTLSCSAWKSIRSHSTTCENDGWTYNQTCRITWMTTTSISWEWDYYNWENAIFSASIICCDD